MDLSLRGLLEIESTGREDGGWVLIPAGPPQDGQDPLEYERRLLEWVARPGYAASLASSPLTCQRAWRGAGGAAARRGAQWLAAPPASP